MNPPFVFASVAAALGVSAGVSGVYLLAGAGWALIAAGASFLAVASFVFRGMNANTVDR